MRKPSDCDVWDPGLPSSHLLAMGPGKWLSPHKRPKRSWTWEGRLETHLSDLSCSWTLRELMQSWPVHIHPALSFPMLAQALVPPYPQNKRDI